MNLSLCLPLDRTICITFLAAVTTLDFRDFSAGFDPKFDAHAVTVGELVCYLDGLQSVL